jgi:bifunctional ADP-heptose synthase (sugar kinase/adenylyltransferase)
MPAVQTEYLFARSDRRTPTYTKPMLCETGRPPRELNRLDIKNRRPMPEGLQVRIQHELRELWPRLDALVVLDQVSEVDCGVITAAVRGQLAELTATEPGKFVLADSRERIGLFRGVSLKPNRQEALRAVGLPAGEDEEMLERAATQLARQAGCWVFCTDGARGILLASPEGGEHAVRGRIASYPVSGPIDIVGAGDSTSAAIVCAMASGSTPETAAAFGNLMASITIQQIGTTGTATPAQLRQRFLQG